MKNGKNESESRYRIESRLNDEEASLAEPRIVDPGPVFALLDADLACRRKDACDEIETPTTFDWIDQGNDRVLSKLLGSKPMQSEPGFCISRQTAVLGLKSDQHRLRIGLMVEPQQATPDRFHTLPGRTAKDVTKVLSDLLLVADPVLSDLRLEISGDGLNQSSSEFLHLAARKHADSLMSLHEQFLRTDTLRFRRIRAGLLCEPQP